MTQSPTAREFEDLRATEHDQVALTALSCLIAFGNKTTKWKRTGELIERLSTLAASTAAKERIEENRKTVQENSTLGFVPNTCWFCPQEAADEKSVVDVAMSNLPRAMWGLLAYLPQRIPSQKIFWQFRSL